MNQPQFIPAQQKKSLNPLFLVLAILSGVPTAFFLLAFITAGGADGIIAAATLWCGLWTWVWTEMARRYR